MSLHHFLLRAVPLALALATPLRAQDVTSAPVCLGFSFGAWTPPLDWRGVGHGAAPDTSRRARALVADGRQANPTSRVRAWAVNCG